MNVGFSRRAVATILAGLQRQILCRRAQRGFGNSGLGSKPSSTWLSPRDRSRTLNGWCGRPILQASIYYNAVEGQPPAFFANDRFQIASLAHLAAPLLASSEPNVAVPELQSPTTCFDAILTKRGKPKRLVNRNRSF